jgi:hypothetical protein
MARRKRANRATTRRLRSSKPSVKRRATSSRNAGFTVADLVALLRSAPKPDAEYWSLVEAINRNQPQVQPRR